MTSKRADSINTSGIRRVFDLAATACDSINLSIGQPDFTVPEELLSAASRALHSNLNGYSQTQGIEPLRQVICDRYCILDTEQWEVIVTAGVSGGLFLSYMALLDPGDEVLIPDPFFCSYRDLAHLVNATPIYYDCYNDFKLPIEKIAAGITDKTKAIVINSPANPTGATVTTEEIQALTELASRYGLWIISDEIYDFYSYDCKHVSLWGRYDKLILLNGFSKSHAVTGWRLGYAIAPKKMAQSLQKLQQYTFVCAPTPLQWALANATQVDLSGHLTDYRRKRDLICSLLENNFDFQKPSGAFYLFVRVPQVPGKSEMSGQEFVERCIKSGLLVVPGNAFSCRDSHFRLSFAAKEETLEHGAKILNCLAREHGDDKSCKRDKS